MSRFISFLVTLLVFGSVTWLASQKSTSSSIVRRLRGSAVTDASPNSSSTGEGDGSDIVVAGFTRKELKKLGFTVSQVKEMMKGPLGPKGTEKLLHGVKHAHNTGNNALMNYLLQLVFGIIFYFLVASKYPNLGDPNSGPSASKDAAAAIMKEPTPCRIKCGAICLQSLCFTPMMYAKVMQATNVANYWIALIANIFFPCCTVFVSTQCCAMDQKLGLEVSKGLCYNAFESCCCSCCLVAQTTEALDAAVGWESGCCSAGPKVYSPVA